MGHAFPHRLLSYRRLGLIVALACVSLAGCGRKGSLEPPPGAPVSQQSNADSVARQARVFGDQDQPGLIQSPDKFYEEPASVKLEAAQRKAAAAGAPRAINAPPVEKKSTFLLDPLL